VKHIRENGSLKSEAAPNQEAAHDRNRGRDMELERNVISFHCTFLSQFCTSKVALANAYTKCNVDVAA